MTETIIGALRKEVEQIAQEEAHAAAQRVETRVREATGQIAAKVLNHFSFERLGNKLVIEVVFPQAK